MTKQEQKTFSTLKDVRNMLYDLLKNEHRDKLMRIRLAISLKIIDAMISAYKAPKHIGHHIKITRNQKSR
ncbi:hypothetical protein HDR61_03930 [bacterium]|nr:hypothetical protein [bacterium]